MNADFAFLPGFKKKGQLHRIADNLFKSDEVFETPEGPIRQTPYRSCELLQRSLTSFHAIACLSGTASVDRDLMQKYNHHENVSRSGGHCDKV